MTFLPTDLEKNLCTAYKKPCPVAYRPEKKDLDVDREKVYMGTWFARW
jgi:hypothetical protein